MKQGIIESICQAKLISYCMNSTSPEKQKKILELRELMDKAQSLVEEIIG